LILRDYQHNILEEVKSGFTQNDLKVVTLGMGGGKSLIISQVAKYYFEQGKNIVILTNITELIFQLKEYLEDLNLDYKVIKSNFQRDFKNNSSNKIWLVMEQSFHENKRLKEDVHCDILIKDEFHIGIGQPRYEKIKEALNPDKILGLTGTPFDSKGFLLEGVEVDNLITHGSTMELTSKGFLTPLKYYIPKWSEKKDYSQVKTNSTDYSNSSLDEIVNTFLHISSIVHSINEMEGKKKKTLVYCNSIENCKKITEALIKDGFKAASIHSENEECLNKECISKFYSLGKDRIDCLVSISKLTTGFNQPQAELLVLTRPTKILRLYLQILFRVARLYPNKKYGQILDLAQCVSRHGFGTENRPFIKPNTITSKDKKKQKGLELLRKNSVFKLIKDGEDINFENLTLKMKELRVNGLDLKKTVTKELMTYFKTAVDIELVILIFFELNFRINNINYSDIEVKILTENIKYEYDSLSFKEQNDFLKLYKNKYQEAIRDRKPF
jgi:superfamily II DNA or RNA helicase